MAEEAAAAAALEAVAATAGEATAGLGAVGACPPGCYLAWEVVRVVVDVERLLHGPMGRSQQSVSYRFQVAEAHFSANHLHRPIGRSKQSVSYHFHGVAETHFPRRLANLIVAVRLLNEKAAQPGMR